MKHRKISAMFDCKCDFCNKAIAENEEYFSLEYHSFDRQYYFYRSCCRCHLYVLEGIESEFYESDSEICPESFLDFMDDFHRQVLDEWGISVSFINLQCCPYLTMATLNEQKIILFCCNFSVFSVCY